MNPPLHHLHVKLLLYVLVAQLFLFALSIQVTTVFAQNDCSEGMLDSTITSLCARTQPMDWFKDECFRAESILQRGKTWSVR